MATVTLDKSPIGQLARGTGNGSGKPRGRKWSCLIEEVATSSCNKAGLTIKEQIIRKLLEMAVEGNLTAIQIVLERMEGKVAQAVAIDHTSNGESLNASISFISNNLPVIEASLNSTEQLAQGETQGNQESKILIT